MEETGHAKVLVKRVRDELPFAAVWVKVRRVGSGKFYFKRPPFPEFYKRGGGGCHYKLLPETFIAD